ncbi:MAG: MauE/DoxX family redox-associated membrane protein [Puniceicoccaceae bacterium]
MKNGVRIFLLIAIGVFFLASGILKLLDPAEFARAIMRYRIVGEDLAAVGALAVPWTEVVAGIGLCFKVWRPASLLLILMLLVVFEFALLSAWMRGLDIECGCLGSGMASTVQFAFFRNIPLLLAAGWLYSQEGKQA